MTEGFVFYKSFYEAIEDLPEADQLAVYKAICQYGLNEEEPECSGVVRAVFRLVKPQIDANKKKRDAGKKGGSVASTESKDEADSKQTASTMQAQCKQSASTSQADAKQTEAKEKEKDKEKVKDKAKENDKAKDKENAKANVLKDSCTEPEVSALADVEAIPLNDGSEWRPTFDELDEYERLYPAVDVRQEFRNMRGWSNSNPTRKKTPSGIRRFVASWLSKEQNTARAAPRPVQRSAFDIARDIARQEGVVNDVW